MAALFLVLLGPFTYAIWQQTENVPATVGAAILMLALTVISARDTLRDE